MNVSTQHRVPVPPPKRALSRFDHESGYPLDIDGAKIYCEEVGDSRGHPLLLLHGGLGSMEDFNRIVPRFGPGFRVIGIDSRGHGKSTLGPAELSYARLEQDLRRIVVRLRLREFSLIGFSDGGIVAYRLASRGLFKIQKLVTIGSHWELKGNDPVRELLSTVTSESWRKKFPDSYEAYQRLNPQPDFDRLVPAVVTMWLDSSTSGYPGKAVDDISCDLLIVRGQRDNLVSMPAVAELAGRVGNSRLLEIPRAGHAAFNDQPETFMQALNEFFKATAGT
jgi:pimeloyl-ACP methyl ester carboxylesterase